jgi:hypothetical protein
MVFVTFQTINIMQNLTKQQHHATAHKQHGKGIIITNIQ